MIPRILFLTLREASTTLICCSLFPHSTRVSCESGKSIEADAVVCTVPLGVLKRGKISFDPDLPEEKKQAIDALGYGLLNKVIPFFYFLLLMDFT